MSDPVHVFVSAFYPLCDTSRFEQIVHNYRIVSRFFHVHLFCPPGFSSTHEFTNTTLHEVPFEELETFKLLSDTTGLPTIRSHTKDTLNYMILMNAKTEFIKRVRDAGVKACHYIWIDAGIGKIFKNPEATFQLLKDRLASNTLPSDRILLPGCYSEPQTNYDALISRVCWRFCGGFFVAPAALVDTFASTVLSGCEEIKTRNGQALWEVNVWAFVEARLPIQWASGDHNETIFNCVA
jgi:hypothetical protein